MWSGGELEWHAGCRTALREEEGVGGWGAFVDKVGGGANLRIGAAKPVMPGPGCEGIQRQL